MQSKVYIALVISWFCLNGFKAHHPSDTDFTSPVKYSIKLAGSFGEIRSRHFHAGIDIRSQKGGGGDSIFSAEEGYISRIKIDRSGYGKSLYLNHPNGYTTVYAHLKNFNPELESYIREMQVQMMSYEIDIVPEVSRFQVTKSEHIAFLGNSGFSFGPHLHFEIRETATDKVINPLLFGIKPFDEIAPEITQIRISGLTPDFDKVFDHKIKIKKDKKGKILPIEMAIPAWRTGIAIKAYDKCSGCVNKNGIFRLEMTVDDTLVYSFDMKSFDFDENKQLSAHTDFEARQTDNSNEILCYRLPGNQLSFIEKEYNQGLINLYESKVRKVVISVSDYQGNTTRQELRLKRAPVQPYGPKENQGTKVNHDESHVIPTEGASLLFHENSFAKNDEVTFQKNPNAGYAYEIKNSGGFLNKFRLAIKLPDSLTADQQKKIMIVKTSSKGGNINYGCEIQGDSLITLGDEAGLYRLFYDTEAPVIKPINFTSNPKGDNFRFKLSDNIACSFKAKDFSYHVWLDDVWQPCEFKELSRTLTIPLNGLLTGEHKLKLEATDQAGNSSSWEGKFTIK